MPFNQNVEEKDAIAFIETSFKQVQDNSMLPQKFIAELETLPERLRGSVDVAKAAVSKDAGALRIFDKTIRSNESVITEVLSIDNIDNHLLFFNNQHIEIKKVDDEIFFLQRDITEFSFSNFIRPQCIAIAYAADSIRKKEEYSDMAIDYMLCLLKTIYIMNFDLAKGESRSLSHVTSFQSNDEKTICTNDDFDKNLKKIKNSLQEIKDQHDYSYSTRGSLGRLTSVEYSPGAGCLFSGLEQFEAKYLEHCHKVFTLLRKCSMDLRKSRDVSEKLCSVLCMSLVLAYATGDQFNNKELLNEMLSDATLQSEYIHVIYKSEKDNFVKIRKDSYTGESLEKKITMEAYEKILMHVKEKVNIHSKRLKSRFFDLYKFAAFEDAADLISVCGSEIKKDKVLIDQYVSADHFYIADCVDSSLFQQNYLLSLIKKKPQLIRTLPYYLQEQHWYTVSMLKNRCNEYRYTVDYDNVYSYLKTWPLRKYHNFTFSCIPNCFRDKDNAINDPLIVFEIRKEMGLLALIDGGYNSATGYMFAKSVLENKYFACYSVSLDGFRAYRPKENNVGLEFFNENKLRPDVLQALHEKEPGSCNRQNLTEDACLKLEKIQKFLETEPCFLTANLLKLFDQNNTSELTVNRDFVLSSLIPFLTAADLCRLTMTSFIDGFHQRLGEDESCALRS